MRVGFLLGIFFGINLHLNFGGATLKTDFNDLKVSFGGTCLRKDSDYKCDARDMKTIEVKRVAIWKTFHDEECQKGNDFAIVELKTLIIHINSS
jgi:hypothetical protein